MYTTIRPKLIGSSFIYLFTYNGVNILYATFMAVLIYFVHYIHGSTYLIFCMLYPWLYEVFAQKSSQRKLFPDEIFPDKVYLTFVKVSNKFAPPLPPPGKRPPTSFSAVTPTNVGIRRQNFLTYSLYFQPFYHTCVKSQAIPSANSNLLNLN